MYYECEVPAKLGRLPRAFMSTCRFGAFASGWRCAGGEEGDVDKGAFEAGRAAYDAGDYQEALQRFQQAHDLSKKPELLYNIGLAADRLRYNRAALQAYRAYVRQLPTAVNRIEVENRIRALEQVIAREQPTPTAPAPPSTSKSAAVDASLSRANGDRSERPLLSHWWFWAAAGGVLAAAIAGVAIATSDDEVGKPVAGSDGTIVLTLSRQ